MRSLPGCNDVDANTLLPRGASKASHDSSNAEFRHIVLWRARLIQVACQTTDHDQTSISLGGLGLPIEIVHCQLYSVQRGNAVHVHNLEIWFDWFFAVYRI